VFGVARGIDHRRHGANRAADHDHSVEAEMTPQPLKIRDRDVERERLGEIGGRATAAQVATDGSDARAHMLPALVPEGLIRTEWVNQKHGKAGGRALDTMRQYHGVSLSRNKAA
jgi:hypothetical protein